MYVCKLQKSIDGLKQAGKGTARWTWQTLTWQVSNHSTHTSSRTPGRLLPQTNFQILEPNENQILTFQETRKRQRCSERGDRNRRNWEQTRLHWTIALVDSTLGGDDKRYFTGLIALVDSTLGGDVETTRKRRHPWIRYLQWQIIDWLKRPTN